MWKYFIIDCDDDITLYSALSFRLSFRNADINDNFVRLRGKLYEAACKPIKYGYILQKADCDEPYGLYATEYEAMVASGNLDWKNAIRSRYQLINERGDMIYIREVIP